MTLRSAYQDFVERTLAGLAGSWQRLTYLGSLADGKGNYSHWGMTKTFGPLQASEALAQAHTDSWLGVLRAPLPLLMGELQTMEPDQGGASLPGKLSPAEAGKLSPMNLGGGSKRHFNSVLLALSLLSRAAKEPNRKAA
jgi:hypothetical protein